jgi:serine/threonine protein kinase
VGTSYRFKAGNMWKLGSKSKAFSTAEVDFLDLCKHSVRSVEDIVNRGNLLNQRQCLDLSSKLSKTTLNIRELVLPYRQPAVLFRPALENLYRYVEKARSLVNECGEEEWWVAAVVQSQNENAFREILLDVSLCYNTIYEQAKSVEEDFNLLPEDLREYSVFRPATDRDIHKDQQDLRNRLEGLANEPSSVSLWDHLLPWRGAPKQYLARYLLVKLNCTSVQSQANTLDSCSAILWTKESEPPGTWGNYRLLGTGAGSSGVCSTKWMGMPCAKKEFHDQESESFFLKEAGILACLKHPCVVNFFCCGNGEERGDRFIAMELMEKSLSKLIEQQRNDYFPLSVVVDIMVQMARGMWYLHNQGVAHRDLKPHNVVVSRLTFQHLSDHFCVKLVDFGMSKTEVNMFKSNTVTAAGIGTTMYRAPEVHPDANPEGKGKVNWFKADVFSFSMTCAHLLSLKRPFRDVERMRELYNELMNGRRPELPTEYPEELLTLLKDCWDSNPHSRPSFMEICKSLEIFRHYFMRGFPIVDEGLPEVQSNCYKGVEFIKTVICLKSSIEGPAAVEVID